MPNVQAHFHAVPSMPLGQTDRARGYAIHELFATVEKLRRAGTSWCSTSMSSAETCAWRCESSC